MTESHDLPNWSAVDRYFSEALLPADAALEAALRDSEKAGLPPVQVSPLQGKLLQLLAMLRGATRILEIGTLGGYSTIFLARALPPEGRLVTLELSPVHAAVARTNLTRAGFGANVEVRVGPALHSLAALEHAKTPPFDVVFIDADKPNNPAYLEASMRLVRPGALIIADNVVRGGAVSGAGSHNASVLGIRRFCELVGRDPRLSATAVQTVGVKGYDGFLLAVVQAEA
jgi:predicted O-methyltransferase YrrM